MLTALGIVGVFFVKNQVISVFHSLSGLNHPRGSIHAGKAGNAIMSIMCKNVKEMSFHNSLCPILVLIFYKHTDDCVDMCKLVMTDDAQLFS